VERGDTDLEVQRAIVADMFDPLRRHFPRAGSFDYRSFAMSREQAQRDISGHFQCRGTAGRDAPEPRALRFDVQRHGREGRLERPVRADRLRGELREGDRAFVPAARPPVDRLYKGFRELPKGRPVPRARPAWYEGGVCHPTLSGGTSNVTSGTR
jgi:hypothetical protein